MPKYDISTLDAKTQTYLEENPVAMMVFQCIGLMPVMRSPEEKRKFTEAWKKYYVSHTEKNWEEYRIAVAHSWTKARETVLD
jgi:hypothetical protein